MQIWHSGFGARPTPLKADSKIRVCLFFSIYYAQTLNLKKNAEKPKIILSLTYTSALKSNSLNTRYSFKNKII